MAVNGGDTSTIDVKGLASSIEVTMSQYDLCMSSKRCIFKTPIALRRHNEKAYTPDAFSIGPLHYGDHNLKATETIKAKYLQGFISRFEENNTMLIDLIKSVNGLEREAREYYAGPIDYSPEEFVKILVIDCCFIIELFMRDVFEQPIEENDPILGTSSIVEVLGHDLILLENQVPWMVLEHLFSMTMAPIIDVTLIQLAISYFSGIVELPPTHRPDQLQDIKHFPDLIKKWLVSSIKVDEEQMSTLGIWDLVPSATRLEEAGIKFRKSSTSKNMFDIKFTNGVLEIPKIMIHEDTETFFRNLISFEQCYPNSDDRFTSYAVLLDNLIDTAKDVEILCENKILDDWLNPEEVAKFFNKLYHDTYVQTYYHGRLCREVNKYCKKRWPRWRAVLVGKYFNTPWAGLSTSAAVILLILTLVQTWYAIMSYKYTN